MHSYLLLLSVPSITGSPEHLRSCYNGSSRPPKMVRHPYKKDLKGDTNLENYPIGFSWRLAVGGYAEKPAPSEQSEVISRSSCA